MRPLYLLLLLSWSCIGIAQQPTWTIYGLPGQVHQYLEHEARLWVATDAGLYSVDPADMHVQRFGENNAGLPSDRVDAMAVDPAGRLWIGTYDMSLAVQNGSDWQTVNLPSGLFPDTPKLYAMEFDAAGTAWIATDFGLASYDPLTDSWALVDGVDAPGALYELAADGSGGWYVAADRLYRYTPITDSWENLTDAPSSGPGSTVWSIGGSALLRDAGGVWFASEFGWVGYYDGSAWTDYTTGPACSSGQTPMLARDASGKAWLQAEFTGLFLLDTAGWEAVAVDHPDLEDHMIGSVFFDSGGERWISGPGRLVRGETGAFETADLSGLGAIQNSFRKFQFAPDGMGYLIAGSAPGRILRYDGSTWTPWSLAPDNCNDLAFTPDGVAWAATTFQGLVRIAGGVATSIPGAPFGNNLRKVLASPDGTVWCGDFDGLYHYDGSGWTTYDHSTTGDLPDDNGMRSYVDPLGRVWVYSVTTSPATEGHLSLYDGLTWTTWNESDGLPGGGPGDMMLESDGSLLMSSWGNGLIRFDGTSTFTVLNPDEGEAPYWVSTRLARDASGRLIVGSPYDGFAIQQEDDTWQHYNRANSPLLADQISALVSDPADGVWVLSASNGLHHLRWNTASAIGSESPSDEFGRSLHVQPNPSETDVIVSWEQSTSSIETRLEVYNSSGQILRQQTLGMLSPGLNSHRVSLTGLPRGTLIIRRVTDSGTQSVRVIHH